MFCMRVLFIGEYWFFFVHGEYTKNTSMCSGENTWRCSQSVTFWYSKRCFGHVKIIYSEGVTVQISLIFLFCFSLKESVTELIYTLKSWGIWIRANELSLVSVMIAQRNVLIFSWSWKIFQHWEWSLQLSKTKTKKNQSEWKRCLNSTQHPNNPVWSSMCLGSSVPQTNGLSNACMLDDKVIIRSHFVQILWN